MLFHHRSMLPTNCINKWAYFWNVLILGKITCLYKVRKAISSHIDTTLWKLKEILYLSGMPGFPYVHVTYKPHLQICLFLDFNHSLKITTYLFESRKAISTNINEKKYQKIVFSWYVRFHQMVMFVTYKLLTQISFFLK